MSPMRQRNAHRCVHRQAQTDRPLTSYDNLDQLHEALADLDAEAVAVPPFAKEYLWQAALLHGSELSLDFPLLVRGSLPPVAVGHAETGHGVENLHASCTSTRWPARVRLLMPRPMIVLYR